MAQNQSQKELQEQLNRARWVVLLVILPVVKVYFMLISALWELLVSLR